jgi:hypothetical protein
MKFSIDESNDNTIREKQKYNKKKLKFYFQYKRFMDVELALLGPYDNMKKLMYICKSFDDSFCFRWKSEFILYIVASFCRHGQ